MENRKDRFKRLASSRTNQILKSLNTLGNCSNRQAYDYSEDQINKIFTEIEKKVKEIKNKFYFPKPEKFKLWKGINRWNKQKSYQIQI